MINDIIMIQTTEILYCILLIAICVLIMVYYRDSLSNLYNRGVDIVSAKPIVQQVIVVDSTDNLFNTEYEVTENANDAISDALKDL